MHIVVWWAPAVQDKCQSLDYDIIMTVVLTVQQWGLLIHLLASFFVMLIVMAHNHNINVYCLALHLVHVCTMYADLQSSPNSHPFCINTSSCVIVKVYNSISNTSVICGVCSESARLNPFTQKLLFCYTHNWNTEPHNCLFTQVSYGNNVTLILCNHLQYHLNTTAIHCTKMCSLQSLHEIHVHVILQDKAYD